MGGSRRRFRVRGQGSEVRGKFTNTVQDGAFSSLEKILSSTVFSRLPVLGTLWERRSSYPEL
jgi:hypothetical protein